MLLACAASTCKAPACCCNAELCAGAQAARLEAAKQLPVMKLNASFAGPTWVQNDAAKVASNPRVKVICEGKDDMDMCERMELLMEQMPFF